MGIDTDNIERFHSDREEFFRKQREDIVGKEVLDEIERTKREYPNFQREEKIVECPVCVLYYNNDDYYNHILSNSPENPDVFESGWIMGLKMKHNVDYCLDYEVKFHPHKLRLQRWQNVKCPDIDFDYSEESYIKRIDYSV